MTGKMRIFLLFVIVVSQMVIETDTAYACSCAAPGPADEELTNSVAVFTGKVVGITKPLGFGSISSADPIKVTFQVYMEWKGSVSQTTTITTSRSSASCGYTFEKGSEYIVYAHGSENDLFVSLCSRTQPLDSAEEDLLILGDGALPSADSTVWSDSPNFQTLVLLGIGIGIIILVVLAIAGIKSDSHSSK